VANIARSMVARYGMVDSLGHLAYEEPQSPLLGEHLFPRKREYSEDTARQIDGAVRDIVNRAYDKARTILAREKPLLERGAQLLLQKETLAEAELAELRRGMGMEKAA
jgi:cell division protease FtsH